MEQDNHFPLEASADESASLPTLDFAPVPVSPRHDGLSPERQREFIEHLADSGIVAEAARLTGVSERSVYRLRRRADARAFALAWDAALAMGVRRIAGLAIERALQGDVQRRYYHGELVEETRVFNDRLLMQILDKADRIFPPARDGAAVANLDSLLDRIDRGDPEPVADPPPAFEERFEVWEDEADPGRWYTNFPPPPGFDGYEERDGDDEDGDYRRTLTAAEQAAIDADIAADRAEQQARAEAARDDYFGFTPAAAPGAAPAPEDKCLIDPLD